MRAKKKLFLAFPLGECEVRRSTADGVQVVTSAGSHFREKEIEEAYEAMGKPDEVKSARLATLLTAFRVRLYITIGSDTPC